MLAFVIPQENQDIQANELASLLAEICRGDEAAFARFYDLTIDHVYGLAFRIAQSHELAEEVVSDVFLQAWQQAKRYDAVRGSVMAWLMIMCRSRAMDALRARAVAAAHKDSAWPEPESPDPPDLVSEFEEAGTVRKALETLEPVRRQLISLAFFRGFSHAELAAFTGLPLGTVKTQLRRALNALRSSIAAHGLLHERDYE